MDPVGLHKKGEVELTQILEAFSRSPNYRRAGAVACFLGVVREDTIDSDAKVTHLEYEAYEDVAVKRLLEIREAIKKLPGVIDVSIHHVVDRLNVGEPSLFVAVLGQHRQNVFPALSQAVERVKKEVPIWKKEYTAKESHWVSSERSDAQMH